MHPSVQEFKLFVQQYPSLVKEVKRTGGKWQPYYEKWVLQGEEDPYWDQYKDTTEEGKGKQNSKESPEKNDNNQKEMMGQFMGLLERVDLNNVQSHIHQLGGAIENIQSLVGQFKEMKKQLPSQNSNSKGKSPFYYGKD